MSNDSTSPITHECRMHCSAAHAFETYTGRIREWWDPRYTATAETLQAVRIEPRVGGRVYAIHRDTGNDDWGEVTLWEPGRRLVDTFNLAQDPRHPTEVVVEFVPGAGRGQSGTNCTFRFAHRGWTEANAEVRKKFGDWPSLPGQFVALADSDDGITSGRIPYPLGEG